MGKITSNAAAAIGRLLKAVMVVVVVPAAVGLWLGVLGQLDQPTVSGASVLTWLGWGFCGYVAVHLLLYRPEPVFRFSHRLFSTVAVWLFGGQVASTEGGAPSGNGKSGKSSGKARKGGGGAAEGSTLVAFSPYVVPLYTVLVCLGAWLLRQAGVDRALVDGPAAALVGATAAFHWVMTADDLQRQRDRWHLETYLLALGLVFLLTLLIGAAVLPLAVPEFSALDALAAGVDQTRMLYHQIVQTLFF